ncbi:hypothetical protein EW026_g1574 [Hermanssonia centrifuga]|uniref:Pre-mRNA-splicing factor 38 n=1 Tax=Hermanssonia centrifuga TaxID=98765 RepID=A0A4S4KQZ6_9APHY|nr:hypothetical protein EW026_g1574 [Hermanssonia centrifuga]
MANTTVRGAQAIHGQNPQFLVETVIRNRIYEAPFWKEHCFALTAESLIDKAIEVKAIGGVYGNNKPTEFMCLLLKLLQIQPEKEILLEYLQADEFKYLRALAAMYIRMTFGAAEVYEILEPLLKDYRKIRLRNMGGYSLTFMDDFVDSLLHEERTMAKSGPEKAASLTRWKARSRKIAAEVAVAAEAKAKAEVVVQVEDVASAGVKTGLLQMLGLDMSLVVLQGLVVGRSHHIGLGVGPEYFT